MAVHSFDVVCVGSANLDTIVTVDRVPLDDERKTTDSFMTAGGGPAATAAVALARLGARVAFCGVVGDDWEGETVRALLENEGVDTRWLRSDPRVRTARAIVIASRETGGRSIVTTIAPAPKVDEIPVDASEWLHVDQVGYESTRRALGRDSSSARLSIDAGNPIATLDLDGVDLFVPTVSALLARYRARDVGEAFDAALAEGAKSIVATAGVEGTYVLTEDGVELVSSFPVEIASTIGAGDVFHGALLTGIVNGHSLARATLFANAAAALACTQTDGRSGIPTWSELQEFVTARRS